MAEVIRLPFFYIVENIENFENGLKIGFKFENKVIVEPLIKNFREFNCSCFKCRDEYIVSVIEEIYSLILSL